MQSGLSVGTPHTCRYAGVRCGAALSQRSGAIFNHLRNGRGGVAVSQKISVSVYWCIRVAM